MNIQIIMNNYFKKNLVSVEDIKREDVDVLFNRADEMKRLVEEKGGDERLKNKILAALFYEPSSRTFSSFITAMQRLGGGFIPFNGMANTSVAKGETLEDTAKVFSTYADIIVFRHPEKGSSSQIARTSSVPVINAGDGIGEHPTQALLDTYTISKHFTSLNSLTIGMIGDLLNGRTVHSLAKLFVKLGIKNFIWVSPNLLKMPEEINNLVTRNGGKLVETEMLADVIGEMDVIYDTRVQKERFTDIAVYEKLKLACVINQDMMKKAKKTALLMHPLPRVGEISAEVDEDPRALYFREQIRNGLYVRMALLDLILNK